MKRHILLFSLLLLILGSLGLSRVRAQNPLAAPTITDWSSTGGHPTNKDDDQDIMYLVEENDAITFHVTVDQPVDYEWQVNKTTQAVNADTFVWTVPDEKGIWEIHLRVHNANGEDHLEWVLSTLSLAEAPEIFDYFADERSSAREMSDPWGRPLPEWSGDDEAPRVSKGFVDSSEGITWSSLLSSIAYGTWKFRYRFPQAMETCGGESISFGFIRKTTGEDWGTYNFNQSCDSHHHCVISHSGADFSIDYDDGVVLNDKWYQVTIIRTRDGWLYMFRDDRIEFLARDEKVTASEFIYLYITGPDRPRRYFDSLEVYRDRYLFPRQDITYGEYVSNYYCENYRSYPIKKEGIIVRGRGVTLREIAEAIGDPSLFTYDPDTRTAISYVNLVVDEGAELIIKDETLKFHGHSDGEREFVLKYASRLYVENSTLTSANQHYWVWNIAGSTTHYGYELKLAEGRYPDYYDFVMVLAGAYHGRFTIKNSVIDNSAYLFLDSPYEMSITDSEITNLHRVDIGNYTFRGSYNDAVRDMRLFLQGGKGFWIYTDDLNLEHFELRNIRVSGTSPLTPTFLINAHRDRLNVYDLDLPDGNILIKESLAQTYRQSHDCYSNGPPYNWKSYIDSGLGLVNSRFDELIIAPGLFTDCDGNPTRKFGAIKYYLDVAVVDLNGHLVPGATVTVTNQVDDANFPAENMEVQKPYTGDLDRVDGGEYCCFYHHKRILQGQPVPSVTTGLDGHTPLPSDEENTLIVTDYVRKIEDSWDGIRLGWGSQGEDSIFIKFDVYDDLHGNILHQVRYVVMRSGDRQHVKVDYDPDAKTVRLLITDPDQEVIWDTGELQLKADFQPFDLNRIRFDVRSKDATNEISWEPGHIKVDTSVYRGQLVFKFDNMKLVAEGEAIEDNDYSSDPGLTAIDEDVREYYDLSSSTGGRVFTWEFDVDMETFDTDGAWIFIHLKDGNDIQDTQAKTITYTYAISATKEGCTGVVTGVDPGPSWYREDPQVPAHTVTVTIPCDLPPAVMGYAPSGSGVSITPTVAITFTEPVSRTTVQEAIAVSGGVSPTGFAWSNGDRTVSFTLTPTLAYLTTYTVTVGPGVADLAGHLSTGAFNWQFTTRGRHDLYLPVVMKDWLE